MSRETADRQESVTQQEVPPSYLREHEFADGDVTCLAKLAQWIPGDPNRLYTYGAREVNVGEVEINPPSTHPETSRWSEMGGFAITEPATIVYFLESFDEAARHRIAATIAALDLHELTHVFVPEEDNHRDEDHWDRWDSLLIEEVGWVMEIDDWGPVDISPAQPSAETCDGHRQADLTEVS